MDLDTEDTSAATQAPLCPTQATLVQKQIKSQRFKGQIPKNQQTFAIFNNNNNKNSGNHGALRVEARLGI